MLPVDASSFTAHPELALSMADAGTLEQSLESLFLYQTYFPLLHVDKWPLSALAFRFKPHSFRCMGNNKSSKLVNIGGSAVSKELNMSRRRPLNVLAEDTRYENT